MPEIHLVTGCVRTLTPDWRRSVKSRCKAKREPADWCRLTQPVPVIRAAKFCPNEAILPRDATREATRIVPMVD